ncbi:mannose-1-phosphate guanylyltransferase/mannose-6-phosphate isomerase [Gilvimarinus sp. DA14]|uniref:mannose-1-phosphate guanylyltransferase/mannose-6-phosphate isomerase n=1 Tax=Gilvimarinus sp. DA14 TaxID=2956798 RepID=UPI0020B78858|nr:mannose-1-phosphate guanylyltransferase/mannose-6-phosphate isomerase [Gilvimarinus sp. DA14]UTF59851.1 mannose-1-phosphate guanylyltransferase/mannose-6-phosphate isomerase [Gilvimarinus sp. DA14]
MIPVILSGGNGTRLWPLSREGFPKQFHQLASSHSMFQETVLRCSCEIFSRPVVVCNQDHRFIIREQLSALGLSAQSILLEPCAKNTAPAIALAALQIRASGSDDVMLVCPADHLIKDEKEFLRIVRSAAKRAENGDMVLLGIQPDHPETGYGYIQRGLEYPSEQGRIYSVRSFKEKPDREAAEQWLETGEYLWNAGIFLFKPSVLLNELRSFAPQVLEACERSLQEAERDFEFVRVDRKQFIQSPSISIDHAVMEQTNLAKVAALDSGWNDIGSWSALWEAGEKDCEENVIKGDAILHSTKRSLVFSQSRLVTAVGLEDIVIVETADAVLVADKSDTQSVKKLVGILKNEYRDETLNHREVFRPWGSFDSIDRGDRFEVKHVSIKPGEQIAMQKHNHRAEHWVVVSGTAEVTCNGEQFLLTENQSTYIPIGAAHQLHNPGLIPLEIIEIRSGGYLGEDDIQRIVSEQDNSSAMDAIRELEALTLAKEKVAS